MTSEMKEQPLVTFALFAYNQERFIREAVEAALAQTYSPLEVILSDDCSSDRTFEIISECAQRYSGPHKVILNRNAKNIGIAAHVNHLVDLAQGTFIVGGAGDDVSYPDRVESTVSAFVSDAEVMSVFSALQTISESGQLLEIRQFRNETCRANLDVAVKTWCQDLQGASHAWRKTVFEVFGPLDNDVVTEDRALPFRAALLGKIRYVEKPLVQYRLHSEGISQKKYWKQHDEFISHKKKAWRADLGVIRGYREDLLRYLERNKSSDLLERVRNNLDDMSRERQILIKLFDSGNVIVNLVLLAHWVSLTGDVKEAVRLLASRYFPAIYDYRYSDK